MTIWRILFAILMKSTEGRWFTSGGRNIWPRKSSGVAYPLRFGFVQRVGRSSSHWPPLRSTYSRSN